MSTARAQLRADDNAGWVWLLPPPALAQRLLCLELDDSRYAEGAAFWHEDVTALNVMAAVEATFREGSLVQERPVAWQPGTALPYGDGVFTQVICRLAGRADGRQLAALLPEMSRVLAAAGCLYVDVDNPGSYQSSGGTVRAGLRRGALSSVLTRAGFGVQSHRAQIFEQGGVNEVIPVQGYRATRNAWRGKERIKQLLLGRVLHRWFAPVHAVIAARSRLPEVALSTLPAFAGKPDFAQFLVNPGKCFVAPEAQSSTADVPLITVVPTRADTLSRRRTELAALARLQAARLPLASLLPRVAREVPFGRHAVFEYEAFAGTTLDLPEPHFDISLQRAARVLTDFNRSSLERRALRPDELAALITRPVAVAGERYPAARTAVERLSAALLRSLSGTAVPVVWQHGDYKLENLVFGNADREVRAIIDWELSAPTGLALVDLLYLMAYAQITRGEHKDILPVMQVRMLPENWDSGCAALLQAYVREFPEVTPFKDACIGLFLLHHVANRFTYDARDLPTQSLMAELMSNIAARLEASVQPSAVTRP
jgi:hypothetical protein